MCRSAYVAELAGELLYSVAAGDVGEVICMYCCIAWVCLVLFGI